MSQNLAERTQLRAASAWHNSGKDLQHVQAWQACRRDATKLPNLAEPALTLPAWLRSIRMRPPAVISATTQLSIAAETSESVGHPSREAQASWESPT